MAELVICKACGFIMEKGKLRDKCPACGVAAKMFEGYVEKISSSRKRVLSLDIHPMLVHFPQAFTVTLTLLSFAGLAVHGVAQSTIASAIVVLGLALPFTVALAIGAGLVDGKIRFRRVTTPLLIKKIKVGSLFFLLACGIFSIVISMPMTSIPALLLITALSILSLICGVLLGLWGVSLINSKFPG
jgi:uncharacterized membrane protein